MANTLTCPHCLHVQTADADPAADIACKICGRQFQASATTDATAVQPGSPRAKPAKAPRADGAKRAPQPRRNESTLILLVAGGVLIVVMLLVCGLGSVGVLLGVGLTMRAPRVAKKQIQAPPIDAAEMEPVEKKDPAAIEDKPFREPVPAEPAADAQERVRNGDFEQGIKGFRTDYQLWRGGLLDEKQFAITSNPCDCHRDAAAFGDHTTGKGKMLMVNGGAAPDDLVWGQTTEVRPGAEYTFRLWVASWHPISPARLDIRINGASIGQVDASNNVGMWREFRAQWNAGAAKTATIEIFDINRDFSGNDFAIDDISLRGPPPLK
jgi:hypothetical protein